MKIFLLILLSFLLFSFHSFGQVSDFSKLEEAKTKLENLQKELWKIDVSQTELSKEISKEAQQKGEFETTKQFELRQKKLYDLSEKLAFEVRYQTNDDRYKIRRRMNEILRTEFIGKVKVSLGLYDADKQLFPVTLNNKSIKFLSVPLAVAKDFKENISEIEFLGNIGILLDADNKAVEYLISATASYKGNSYQTISTDLNESQAMNLVFGNFQIETENEEKYSTWKTYFAEDFENFILNSGTVSPVFFKKFNDSGAEKYLLLAKINEISGGCRTCGYALSVAVFSKDKGQWKVELAEKNVGEQAFYNEHENFAFIKIGKNKTALKSDWGFTHMGETIGVVDIFEIDNNVFRKIFSETILEDTSISGMVGEYSRELTSRINFVQGINPEYFDIKVITTGRTAIKSGRRYILKPYNKTEMYTYTEGKYKKITK